MLAPKRSGPLERFFRTLTLSAEGQVKRSKDKKKNHKERQRKGKGIIMTPEKKRKLRNIAILSLLGLIG
ncbi:hypothetical protein NGA79_10400, partial [Lactococcus garvieae]|uniref:hypothetical protein n=1 Tax=Lactococcus garvieae TaxID=1363 RepID=UPI0024358768